MTKNIKMAGPVRNRRGFIQAASGFLFALLLITIAAPQAHASALGVDSPPAIFIKKMGDTALMSLTGKDITMRDREARVRTLLQANFDLTTIGRFALGPHWRTATAAQKTEYLDLFEDMIVKTYAQRFGEYSGQSFNVAGALKASDTDFIVSSQILQNGGPPVNVEWRVRQKNGQMKVIDVIVESISMSVTQRSDFSAVIQRNGGSIAALIDSLRLRKNGAIAEKD